MADFGIYLLQSSACLAAFYLFYIILLSKYTHFHWNRYYLLIGLVLSFVLPCVELSIQGTEYHHGLDTIIENPLYEVQHMAVVKQDILLASDKSDYTYLLPLIYWTVVVVLAARYLISLVKVVRLANDGVAYSSGGIKFVETNIPAPFTFFRSIFIPQHPVGGAILRHETAHVKQHHWLDLVLMEVASTLLWFNPVAIFYKKALKIQHEYLADAFAISGEVQQEHYLSSMLLQIQSQNSHGPISPFYSKSIKQRINMITKIKTPNWLSAVYMLFIPLVCFLLFAFSKPSNEPKPISTNTKTALVQSENKPSMLPVHLDKLNRVSSHFGFRVNPFNKKRQLHKGTDLSLPAGEGVMSTEAGTVVESKFDDKKGNYVIVKHNDTYSTAYYHLQSTTVKKGDPVSKGQLIGYVGSTGASTAPHLHYEVRVEGYPVDPKDYLPSPINDEDRSL